ncbi:hypothetical protein AALF15_12235 [Corynebacteriaceae bacterium 7-707]
MAKTAQHKPGDNSIDEVTPKKQQDGTWVIRWRWWPWDGGPARSYRHQGPTRGEALRKAREKARELDAGTGSVGRWSKASRMRDYIEQVSRPAVLDASTLADESKSLYGRALTILADELGDKVVADAARPDVAVAAIERIARAHGAQTGRTARSVAGKWVYGRLKRSRIIAASPLADVEIDYGTTRTGTKAAGGVALSSKDYDRALEHLLERDPATEDRPARSRESAIVKEQLAIDVTLLQMVTGLRLGSVRQIEPSEVVDNSAGGINIFVPAEKLKGRRKSLTVTVLDDRVAERVRALRDATPAGAYVYGAPADQAKQWERRAATRAIEALYIKTAADLGISELERDIRSHGWRTTLNVLYYHLPASIRAEWFGHTETVNAAHYVADQIDLSPMVAAAAERRRVSGE